MTPDIAKQAIDLLFKMYDDNIEDAIINHTTKGLVIDFIGGEPFMNVELMDYILDYFITTCLERNHPWLEHFRVGFASNGMLYFNDDV